MADDSGAEKPSTLPEAAARNKRALWQAGRVVALIVLGSVVIWLAHKQALFSVALQKVKALEQSPTRGHRRESGVPHVACKPLAKFISPNAV